jgi:alkaline phosphatase
VPVFAFGPGAERFGGVLDNTDVAWRLGELLGLTGFPAAVPD